MKRIKRASAQALLGFALGTFFAGSAAAGGGFLALGAGMFPDYEGSDDYEAMPGIFGSYAWDNGRNVEVGPASFSERAARVSGNLIAKGMSETWVAGPLLQYRLERDDVDNNRVDKMEKVDAAVEAGAFVGFKKNGWSAELSFAADVSDKYSGYVAYLKAGYDLSLNEKWDLAYGAHLTYADGNYMDAYFGVSKSDALRSGLRRYDTGSDFKDAGLSLRANYAINKKWGLLGSLLYTRMLQDAKNSPVVDDAGDQNQFGVALAVSYTY